MPVFPLNSAFPVESWIPLVVTPQSDIMFAAPDATAENPMTADNARLASLIASEINARPDQVKAAVALLDEGATVPFIARYRKEVTGGLDDTQLRTLAERLVYLRELNARRASIVDSITGQGKMTDELMVKIMQAGTKAELEDLYLPYKPKRRTRAEIARERGLGPLAEAIWENRAADPAKLAEAYVKGEVADEGGARGRARHRCRDHDGKRRSSRPPA